VLNFNLKVDSDKGVISLKDSGAYYVSKKRVIKVFRFGHKEKIKTATEASALADKFVSERIDCEDLIIQLVD